MINEDDEGSTSKKKREGSVVDISDSDDLYDFVSTQSDKAERLIRRAQNYPQDSKKSAE